jgi:hypothetical protein
LADASVVPSTGRDRVFGQVRSGRAVLPVFSAFTGRPVSSNTLPDKTIVVTVV